MLSYVLPSLLAPMILWVWLTPGQMLPGIQPLAHDWQRRGAGWGGHWSWREDVGLPGLCHLRGFWWGVGDTGRAVTLQQAQYFQQSSSSSARSSKRKMSRGMSHQKEPGGQSRKEKRERRRRAVPMPSQGLPGPPPLSARRPAHPSSCAPGRCCWVPGHRRPPRCSCSCSHRPRLGRSSILPLPLLSPQTVSRVPHPTSQHPRAQSGVPYSGAHPVHCRAGGSSPGKNASPLAWGWGPVLPRSLRGCKSVPPTCPS